MNNASFHHDSAAHDAAGRADASWMTLPPFSMKAMQRQITFDLWLRALAIGAIIAVLIVFLAMEAQASFASWLALAIVMVCWLALNMINIATSRQITQITLEMDRHPDMAEHNLVAAMSRRPLMRWVRLLLYHRMALLRHRQQRFDESAAICQAVLSYPLGTAASARASLLLTLAEAELEQGNLPVAYIALMRLHTVPTTLVEALQRLVLQTRYEVACGYDSLVLRQYRQKIRQAECMPAAACGTMHGLLFVAASRLEQNELAHWLHQRMQLLLEAEQVRQFEAMVAEDGQGMREDVAMPVVHVPWSPLVHTEQP